MEIATLKLTGMQARTCADKIAAALNAVDGVGRATVNLSGKRASVNFDAAFTDVEQLKQVVRDTGFGIKPVHGEDGVCCGSCQ